MKKIFSYILALCSIICLFSFSNSDNAIIKVRLEGCESDSATFYIVYLQNPDKVEITSIPVINGSFTYEVEANEYRLVTISMHSKERANSPAPIRFVTVPKSTADIVVTPKGFDLGGDEIYKKVARAKGSIAKIQDEDEKLQEIINYITKNPDDEGALYIATDLHERIIEGEKLLSDRVKSGPIGGYFDYFFKKVYIKHVVEDNASKIKQGKKAPDFTLKTLNGNDFTLSSLRGKYVVLDFWGSWCVYCIKDLPEMQKFYKKYQPQGNLEFVSIACNDTDKAWRAAIEKYLINWVNVFSPDGEESLNILYGITGFPTKIIINPEGNIAGVYRGGTEEFYSSLKDMISNSK